MSRLYTASEMHEVYCKANALDPKGHPALLTRFRYMAKRGMLGAGAIVDERGTYAFAVIEVYRAAIYTELAGLAMDLRAFQPIVEAAERRHPNGLNVPASMRRDAGWASRGGLRDAIHGVALSESWALRIELKRPFAGREGRMAAEFVWKDPQPSLVHEPILSRSTVRTRASVDLSELFAPILEIVGVPDEPGLPSM